LAATGDERGDARRRGRELLLCCARVRFDEGARGRVRRLVSEGIEWEDLAARARRQGMLPLLCWRLEDGCAEQVPPAVRERLRRYFRANAARNLRRTRQLLDVVDAFERARIPLLLYKGPLLAEWIYGHASLREYDDLDVVVRPADLDRAGRLLLEMGFAPQFALSRAQEDGFRRFGHHFCFRLPDGTQRLELHWRLGEGRYPFLPRVEDWWDRACRVRLGGRLVPSPCAEDLLSALCVHGATHLWCRLEWISGVARLIAACPHLDWDQVLARTSAGGSERLALLAFRLAGGALGAPVPAAILERAGSDRGIRREAKRILDAALAGEADSDLLLPRPLFHLRMLRGSRSRLRYLFRILLMPSTNDVRWVRLPRAFASLYYLTRPVRLTGGRGRPWRPSATEPAAKATAFSAETESAGG
jgi:hypothetical protein